MISKIERAKQFVEIWKMNTGNYYKQDVRKGLKEFLRNNGFDDEYELDFRLCKNRPIIKMVYEELGLWN